MADESKLVDKVVFGPFERVNYIVYEVEKYEKLGGQYVLVRQRIFQDKETGRIISKSYLGLAEKSS